MKKISKTELAKLSLIIVVANVSIAALGELIETR